MPHQCTKCGKVLPDASEELLKGCECGSRFFYYIKQAKFDEMQQDVKNVMEELEKADKDQIEEDIRELTGMDKKPDEPVILDLESVKVLRPGKFEIDIVNLFSKNRPLIYKLGEGKYIIDIASTLENGGKGKKFTRVIDTLDDSELEGEEDFEDNENIDEKKESEENQEIKGKNGNKENNKDIMDKENKDNEIK